MLAAILALSLQAQVATAAEPAATPAPDPTRPETWEIAYDIAVMPYLEDYRRCLNYGHRVARGVADFEAQHSSDLPRCADVLEESVEASNKALERRGRTANMPPEMVERVFAHQGRIHVERGRNIDQQFKRQLASYMANQKRMEEMHDTTD